MAVRASGDPPPRIGQPECSVDRSHHGVEYAFVEALFHAARKAQVGRAWDGIRGCVAYDLDAIDRRSHHLVVALHDPTLKKLPSSIAGCVRGRRENKIVPHVSTNEDKFFGHFIGVDEKILKLLFELHTRVVLRKLFRLRIPTLIFAKTDGLQEYRASEQVRCSNSPLTSDPGQGVEVHREQRLPQL